MAVLIVLWLVLSVSVAFVAISVGRRTLALVRISMLLSPGAGRRSAADCLGGAAARRATGHADEIAPDLHSRSGAFPRGARLG